MAEETDLFKNVGRNDPCPCGSGKKYKKCCFRTHRIDQEAQKQTVSVEGLVSSTTTPWEFYKILTNIYKNNIANLLWDLGHDQSPFREEFPDMHSFLGEIATGVRRLPAGPDYDLLRIRHDGPDVLLLLASGHDNPKMQSVRAEIVTLRPNQIDADRKLRKETYYGYRIWSLKSVTSPKSETSEDPTFEDFGVVWQPVWKDVPEGWYPPLPVDSDEAATPVECIADVEFSAEDDVAAAVPSRGKEAKE